MPNNRPQSEKRPQEIQAIAEQAIQQSSKAVAKGTYRLLHRNISIYFRLCFKLNLNFEAMLSSDFSVCLLIRVMVVQN